jgi:hypothetical protein
MIILASMLALCLAGRPSQFVFVKRPYERAITSRQPDSPDPGEDSMAADDDAHSSDDVPLVHSAPIACAVDATLPRSLGSETRSRLLNSSKAFTLEAQHTLLQL